MVFHTVKGMRLNFTNYLEGEEVGAGPWELRNTHFVAKTTFVAIVCSLNKVTDFLKEVLSHL